MSPGWNLFNSQDSRIASQVRISTGRQRAEPPPLDYPHAATGSPDLGVNLPKTAGQKHKKYPRFQVEIGGISFHLFPQVAGGFAFLPYAAILCGTQRMEIRRFKITFRLLPLDKTIVFHFYDFVLVLSAVSSRCQLYSVGPSEGKLIPNSVFFIQSFREFRA